MKVQLEKGVWLADGDGDPSRTLVEENAKEFNSNDKAIRALSKARKYRSFKNAVIQGDFF